MARHVTASRAFFRRKLNSLLEIADDEGFVQLLWAVNALQSDAEQAAAPYLAHRYPPSAVTTDLSNKLFLYKWEIETLANELLVVPKRSSPKRGRTRQLIIDSFDNIVTITNYLRKLENAEDVRGINSKPILLEIARIANRQFDWQRGYHNVPQFYRNAFVYGQGDCANFFEEKHGITVNQLSLVGFGIYATLAGNPVFNRHGDMTQVGVTAESLECALALISSPIESMRALARKERSTGYHTAYRPSVLRRYPCLTFGDTHDRIRAPLPQLILERVTAGVFYDVVGGGGIVRSDYGRRFEQYCLNYLRAMLPTLDWLEEINYVVRKNAISTPDILLMESEGLGLVIECKATRMGYGAKFGEGELDERGFEDIIKAVFQLWRFFSHCRRGLTDLQVGPDAVGAVLTLDNWLLMAKPLQHMVLAAAKAMAVKKDPLILEEDQRPIAFFSVKSMEETLRRATPTSFLRAVRAAASPKFEGWMLDSVHEDFQEEGQPDRDFPFRNDMGRLLPWWDIAEEEKARQAREA